MSKENKATIIEFIGGMREGGAESLVTDYARLIDKNEFRIIIISVNPIDPRSPYVKLLHSCNGTILSVYNRFPVARTYLGQKLWNRFCHRRYVANKLLSYIKLYQAEVIHVHLEILHYLSPISKELKNLKILYTCHNAPNRYFNNHDRSLELATAQKLFAKNDFRIIALHEEMKLEINKLFNVNNTIVIHNGVDFNRFLSVSETKEDILGSLGIPRESFVIGHIGRFAEAKNHPFIVKVFKEVVSRNDKAFLLLIGTGPMIGQVTDMLNQYGLEGRYKILNFRSDIPRLLKSMDVFLFPSLFEGLPVTLVEAQVAGTRCVVSNRINTESFFLPTLISLDLEQPVSDWADAVLDTNRIGEYNNDISVFDMNKEIKKLEKLYQGKVGLC